MHAKGTYQKRREREREREGWNEQKRFSERTSAKGRKRMLKWKYKFSVHPNHLYYCEWEIVHSPILGAAVVAVAAGVGVALYEFSTCLHHVGFLFPLFTFNQLLLISVAVYFFLSLSLCHFFPLSQCTLCMLCIPGRFYFQFEKLFGLFAVALANMRWWCNSNYRSRWQRNSALAHSMSSFFLRWKWKKSLLNRSLIPV